MSEKRDAMNFKRWLRIILSPFFFGNILKGYHGRVSLMKIRSARAYVLFVQKFRVLLIAVLICVGAVILFAGGLLLVHAALFSFSAWSSQTKFWLALLLGAGEMLGAGIIFYCLLKEEVWGKFYGIPNAVRAVLDEKSASDHERRWRHEIKTNEKKSQ